MPMPRKYHTDEERKAAARATQARWREKNRERLRQENRERQKKLRAENPALARERSQAWRDGHPGRAAELRRKYVEADPERMREIARRSRKLHAEAHRNRERKRRVQKLGSAASLAAQEWLDILEEFDHCCAYCQARGVKLGQEHMTPLSRGGRHTASNVVPACGSCNRRKGTKTIFEFLGRVA